MGNTDHVLRRGIVCGKCNNYFASKVEKPFLEQPDVVALRFEQAIPSKKGRVPSLPGILLPVPAPIEVFRDPLDGQMSIAVPEPSIASVMSGASGRIVLPVSGLLRPNLIVSRFLAKVALEALASRIEHDEALLHEVVNHPGLDMIREHARYSKIIDWPVSIRRIYDASSSWTSGNNQSYQIVHEFDFLALENGEIYFALAIFGQELVINMGGPELGGWHSWLEENQDATPLHCGRNAGESKVAS